MKIYVEAWRPQLMAWHGEAPDGLSEEELKEWVYANDRNAPDHEWECISDHWEEPKIEIDDRNPRWIRTKEMHLALLSWKTGDYVVFIEDADETLQGPMTSELDIIRAKGATFIVQENM